MSASISFAVVGYALLAVVTILDKLIVSQERVKPIIVTFYSTAPLVLVLLAAPFKVIFLQSGFDWFITGIAGISFVGGLYAMYSAFINSEVSHSGPLMGAVLPLCVVALSYWLLGERVSAWQLGGIIMLVAGSYLIAHGQNREHGWKGAFFRIMVAGLCFAISNVASKYLYDHYNFYSGFIWTRGAIGLIGMLLFLLAPVRGAARWPVSNAAISQRRAGRVIMILVDKIAGVVAVILVQYAAAMGSVAVVNALAGIQYGFLVVAVAMLSSFFPQIFKEQYRRGEVIQEGIAVGVIAVGLVLIIL